MLLKLKELWFYERQNIQHFGVVGCDWFFISRLSFWNYCIREVWFMINAWISPEGELLKCGLMEHSNLAFKIIDSNEQLRKKLEESRSSYSNILDFMYEAGFREVRTWPSGKTYFLPEDKKWNSHQVKIAINICIELEIKTPEVLYG